MVPLKEFLESKFSNLYRKIGKAPINAAKPSLKAHSIIKTNTIDPCKYIVNVIQAFNA